MNPSDRNHHHHHHHLINQQVLPGRLSCDSYVSRDIRDYGDRVRKSAEYYAKFRKSWSGPLIADAAATDDDEDGGEEGEFGFSTPQVWGPTSPGNYNYQYRNLPPASKVQAIARGQRELMEMVSEMPESSYELSLKDLVEQQQQKPPIVEGKKQEAESEKGGKKKKMEIVKKKNGSVSNNKNKNNDGFLLKMVFPLAFGMKKKNNKNKKKSELGSSYSFKVAPRPPMVEGCDKAVDKEWWKKRFEQSESESSGSSSNNGSGKSSVSSNSTSSLSRNSSRYLFSHPNKSDLLNKISYIFGKFIYIFFLKITNFLSWMHYLLSGRSDNMIIFLMQT